MTLLRTADIAARVAAVPCLVCGGTPTAYVRFYGAHGITGTPSSRYVDGPFCHDCGVATFRTATAWLLSSGWLRPSALVGTPVQALINIGARIQVGRATAARHEGSLPLGKPLVRRWRAYRALIPLAVLAVVAGGIVLGIQALGTGTHDVTAGDCVEVSGVTPVNLGKYQFTMGQVRFVPCTATHNGTIVVASAAGDCPAQDAYLEQDDAPAGTGAVPAVQYCIAPAA